MAKGNNFSDALNNAYESLDLIHMKVQDIQKDTLEAAKAVNAAVTASNGGSPNAANSSMNDTGNKAKKVDTLVKSYNGLILVETKQNKVIQNMISLEKQRNTTIAKTFQSIDENFTIWCPF